MLSVVRAAQVADSSDETEERAGAEKGWNG